MFSKFILLFAFVACAHSTQEWLLRNGLVGAPLLSTGVSSGERTQDAIGNYAFNYGIADGIGATNSRAESGDVAGNRIGSYSLTDIDGRTRRVDYVADGLGFRASVRTNEPGTALSAPAAASVVSPYSMPVAPAPIAAVGPAIAAAPAFVAAPAIAAPIPTYSAAIGVGLAAPLLSAGVSSSSRTQDGAGNYAFNYGIADGIGATNSRAESGDAAGNKIGSYSLTDIDGRARRVDYVADSLGFRASVKTNEPGTAMSTPADAAFISPYAMPVAPAPIAAAAPLGAVASPVVAAAAPVSAYSTVIGSNTGASRGERVQDAIGNYAFNYGIADGIGATNSRAESGDSAGNKIGSYSLTDIDGRARRVDYVADGLGFRASVNTNEQGTALSAPASTAIVSPYAMPVAPAPVAIAAAAAPVAAFNTAIGHGAALANTYGLGLY